MSENEPKTPASQPVKRLSVLSPFSAASPQHRRPSKILKDANERSNQDQGKGYPIFQPYEADPNIEMTLCEQSTVVEPRAESPEDGSTDAGDQLDLSTRTLTEDDTPAVSDLVEQITPEEEADFSKPDTDVETGEEPTTGDTSSDVLKIDSMESLGPMVTLADELVAAQNTDSDDGGTVDSTPSESTDDELFPKASTGLSLADELAASDLFTQSPAVSEKSRDAFPNFSVAEDFEREEETPKTEGMTALLDEQNEESQGPATDEVEAKMDSTMEPEELASGVSDGNEEEYNQSTLEDIISTVMSQSVAKDEEEEDENDELFSDITSQDVPYTTMGELCPILEESPSQPMSSRQLRHISETSLLNRTSNLSDSLAEFMSLENKFEKEGDDGLVETYRRMTKDAHTTAQELEDKLAQTEKALELALKERDDYQYLHETEVKKAKKETSSLKMRCHELENELEAVQQKQLSESAISNLEVVGDKLDTMMKESEMQQEANERLEKELQMANARLEELDKANEEYLRQKTKLEDDLQLRDDSLAQAQAEVERLSTEKEMKDKELEEAVDKVIKEMAQEVGGYKKQLEELQTDLEELQVKTQMEIESQKKMIEELESQVTLRDDAIAQGQAEIERLITTWKAAEDAKEELEKMVKLLEEKGTDEFRQEKEQLDSKLAQSEELMARIQAELVSLKDELSETTRRRDELEAEAMAEKKRLEESECHRIGLEAEMESYKTQLDEIRSALDKAQNEKEEALHRCDLGASELARLREQLEDMETELTKKYKAAKELELLVEKLTEEKKILEEEKGHSDEAESYKGQLEEVQGLLVKLHQEKRDLTGHLEELQSELQAKEESLVQAKSETDRLATVMEEAAQRKDELVKVVAELNSKVLHLEQENAAIGMYSAEAERYKTKLNEAKRQELLHGQRCRELESEVENLRQKQLLENQLEDMKRRMMEGFDRLGTRLSSPKEEEDKVETPLPTVTYKAELEEAQEEIKKHLETIAQLEMELEKERKEAARALKLCDEMDDVEDDYKKRIGELVEEVDRLKAKCGEAEKTEGLLQALRPQNVDRLSPGSVNTSLNNSANNMTSAPATSPKTPARGEAEKTFMGGMEQTRLDPNKSPATNNTCRQQ